MGAGRQKEVEGGVENDLGVEITARNEGEEVVETVHLDLSLKMSIHNIEDQHL